MKTYYASKMFDGNYRLDPAFLVNEGEDIYFEERSDLFLEPDDNLFDGAWIYQKNGSWHNIDSRPLKELNEKFRESIEKGFPAMMIAKSKCSEYIQNPILLNGKREKDYVQYMLEHEDDEEDDDEENNESILEFDKAEEDYADVDQEPEYTMWDMFWDTECDENGDIPLDDSDDEDDEESENDDKDKIKDNEEDDDDWSGWRKLQVSTSDFIKGREIIETCGTESGIAVSDIQGVIDKPHELQEVIEKTISEANERLRINTSLYADGVIGVKTNINQIGNNIVVTLIGTAVVLNEE